MKKNVQRTLAFSVSLGIICFVCRSFGAKTIHTLMVAACLCAANFLYIFFSFGKNLKRSVIAAALAAIFCVFGTVWGDVWAGKRLRAEALASDLMHTVSARVDEVTYVTSYGCGVIAEITEIDGESTSIRAAVYFPFDPSLETYDVFRAEGTFSKIDTYTSFYESEGVFVGFDAEECEYISTESGGISKWIKSLSGKLSSRLSSLIGGDEGAVASAITLGDRSGITAKMNLDFRRSGLSHVIAVSGMHLSVIILFLRFALGFVGKKKKNAILIAITLFYMALTGFSPSVCRAAIMMSAFLLADMLGEESDGITSLFVAMAIILAVSPQTVYAAGFWLSCFATFGILVVSPAFKFKFLYPKKENGRIKRILKSAARYFLTLTVASCAAQTFTLPIIFLTFGGVSAFSSVSGIIAIPLAEAALILSMLTCIFSFVPIISSALAAVARLPLAAFIFTAKTISGANGAYISIRQPFSIYIIAVGTVVVAAIILIRKADRRLILAVGALEVAAFCVCLSVFGAMNAKNTDIIYSVNGTNESVVVSARGNVFVFDVSSGGYSALRTAADNVNDIYLEEIDYVVLTHLHANHVNSLQKLTSSIKVSNILIPTAETDGDASVIRNIRYALGNEVNILFYNRAAPSEIEVENLKITLPRYVKLKRSTHPIVAFAVEENGYRVTYLGASCAEANDEYVNEIYLNADCLIVGVHGPKTDETPPLEYTAAQTVVFGGDEENYDLTSQYPKNIIFAKTFGNTVKIRFESD